MRRFYKEAAVVEGGGGFALELDGKPVKTPARAALAVPTRGLAEAIAGEWRAQGGKIDPQTMKLSGLANAAIDRIAPDPAAFAAGLVQYGESDLLCYRADGPAPLVARQAEHWDPVLAWARRRYDVELKVVTGVMHQAQPEATIARLGRAITVRAPFELAGLSPLVTVSSSLIIALALAEGELDVERAWAAATVDDQWQLEKWGEDSEAVLALANRRGDFEAGARLLELLQRS